MLRKLFDIFFREHIAGRAYFKRDLLFGKFFHQIFVLHRRNPVPDSFGVQNLYRVPHRFWSNVLSCVCNRVQPFCSRFGKNIAEQIGRSFLLRTAKPNADDFGRSIIQNQLKIARRIFCAECARHIEQHSDVYACFRLDFSQIARIAVHHLRKFPAFFEKCAWGGKNLRVRNAVSQNIGFQIVKKQIEISNAVIQILNLKV